MQWNKKERKKQVNDRHPPYVVIISSFSLLGQTAEVEGDGHFIRVFVCPVAL